MKKKKTVRLFNFSDAVLVAKGKEKIAFMRRDALEFEKFGISNANFAQLENNIDLFSDAYTDIEALNDQTEITKLKDNKAEELRVAIRAIMSRVELKFGAGTSKYAKFGTQTLSRQTDADLFITGKRVVRTATSLLDQLKEKGISQEMIANLALLSKEFETNILDLKIKIGDRDVNQEERVEAANAIYSILVSYTNTGQSIWTTSNVAKYNDFVLYNTTTGEAPEPPSAS